MLVFANSPRTQLTRKSTLVTLKSSRVTLKKCCSKSLYWIMVQQQPNRVTMARVVRSTMFSVVSVSEKSRQGSTSTVIAIRQAILA